jgi:hypothetical protein
LNSYAARSPILEGKNIMQFFSPPWFKKEIQKDLPDKRPFLICYVNEELTEQEKFFYDRSEELFKAGNYTLARLNYSTVFEHGSEHLKNEFDSLKQHLVPSGSSGR